MTSTEMVRCICGCTRFLPVPGGYACMRCKRTTEALVDCIEAHVAVDQEAKAAGRKEEREAIVAWLRRTSNEMESSCGRQGARADERDDAADRIETGEHLR